MSNTQLYIAVGIPILVNGAMLLLINQGLSARLSLLEQDMRNVVNKLMELDSRISKLEAKAGLL